MLKRLSALALVGLGLAATVAAQVPQKTAQLAYTWDMDGEAADDDQVVIVGNGALTDSKTFTITAQPDVCRLVDATVVDANSSITAGGLTVVGTDCMGYAKTCSHTFTGAGSGVKTFVCTDGRGAYFSNISSVTTGALTGEGAGDTVIIGYTSNSQLGEPMYGVENPPGPNGEHSVNPFAQVNVATPITTSGSYTTTVTSAGAFGPIAVNDLIFAANHWVKVTAKASNSSITVSEAVTVPSIGQRWAYRKFFFSTDPADELFIPVAGYSTLLLDWAAANVVATGGLQLIIQGHIGEPGWPSTGWVTLCPVAGVDCAGVTKTVASGSSQSDTSETIDLTALPYAYIKVGLKFGSGDDAGDAPAESIRAAVTLR